MRSRLAALALVAAAATAGCTKIVNTDDLEPLVDAQGFCEAMYSTYIEVRSACTSAVPTWGEQLWSSYSTNCTLAGRSAQSGLLAYDRAKGEACIAKLRGVGCDGGYWSVPECAQALVALGQVGDSCNSYRDCDPATTDSCYFIGSNTCPGKCLAPRSLGDDCLSYGPICARGTYCDYGGSGKCVQGPDEYAACAAGATCGNGYYCTSANYCLRWGRSGMACPGGYECDNGFFCDVTRTTWTCQPMPEDPIRREVGDNCDYPWTCGPGLYCPYIGGPGSTCQAQKGTAGQKCTNYGECISPLLCTYSQSQADYFCLRPAQTGEACLTRQYQCATGLSCKSSSGLDAADELGTCRPPSRVGGDCGSVGEYLACLDGWCDEATTHKCTAFKAEGAACTDHAECAANTNVAECRTISPGNSVCKRTCG